MKKNISKRALKQLSLAAFLFVTSVFTTNTALATIVQFQTNMGSFDVNLYDEDTPNTVANFLTYRADGDYTNSISHRAVADFIVQGGGFVYNDSWPVDSINSNAAVANEPVFSNVRGTIAMAKISGNPDSATSQWFFNLTNNSAGGAQLDTQNGGFTVFGEVMDDGMTIVDQIGTLPLFNFGGALAELPLQNFANDGTDPNETNLVIITSIIVLDASADTASALSPPLNTLISAPPPVTPPPASSGGGGGSMGAIFLGLVLLLGLRREVRNNALFNNF